MEQPGTIDISAILHELDAEIAEAQQRKEEASLRLADLQGQRRGVLLVFERSQRPRVGPAVITEGEGVGG